jgi:phosphoglycerate kinase
LAGIRTLDDVKCEEKTVLLRVDINCPTDDKGALLDTTRIKAVLPTISELSERNAKVVILAHQGRFGKPDCFSLANHAKALETLLGEKVIFVPKPNGPEAIEEIKKARWGDILLLENQRFDKAEGDEKTPEEHSKDPAVIELSKAADLFVNDAFAAAHRSQRSLVGFCPLMQSVMGRVMEKELAALSKLVDPERPAIFIFGGAKLDGVEALVEKLISKGRADKILLGGLTGLAFVMASGHSLGVTDEKIQKEATLEGLGKMAELLEKYPLKILIPTDHAIDDGKWRAVVQALPAPYPILDIGPETIRQFTAEIANAKTIFISGPPGYFEKKGFEEGSKAVLTAMAERTDATTIIGGGHTNAAIEMLGLTGRFTYQSTGGGALETFITGGHMPVLDALRGSAAGKA